jgi:hypothetical protein
MTKKGKSMGMPIVNRSPVPGSAAKINLQIRTRFLRITVLSYRVGVADDLRWPDRPQFEPQ